MAKTKSGQTPSDENSFSIASPTPNLPSSNLTTNQSHPTTASNHSQNATIILNPASWVSGFSAALSATSNNSFANVNVNSDQVSDLTSPNPNAVANTDDATATAISTTNSISAPAITSIDDHTLHAPRYIPYIEFENYSAYGNLIFDLNPGFGRTPRLDCKPDGLEKAPPQALEQQFVRIKPSHDVQDWPANLQRSDPQKHSRRKSRVDHAPAEDLAQPVDLADGPDQEPRGENSLRNLNDKMSKKKRKKKKKQEGSHMAGQSEKSQSSGKIHSVSLISSSKNNLDREPPEENSSAHFKSNINRPSSSVGNGIFHRPNSALDSGPVPSEGNQSVSASEAVPAEPWAVPRSGRFWGHDDRQNHLSWRGGDRALLRNRGGGGGRNGRSSSARGRSLGTGKHVQSSPSSRNRPLEIHHPPSHRPDTPAGQSDTARSVGSGAGWITVQTKQRGFGNGGTFSSRNNPYRPQSQLAEESEWRHDGWEEIEREADRPNRGKGSRFNHSQMRGAGKGVGVSNQNRRQAAIEAVNDSEILPVPTLKLGIDKTTQPSDGPKADGWTTKSPEPGRSPPRGDLSEVKVSLKPKAGSDTQALGKSCETNRSVDVLTKEKVTEKVSTVPPVLVNRQIEPVLVKFPAKAIKIGTIPVYHRQSASVISSAEDYQKTDPETLPAAEFPIVFDQSRSSMYGSHSSSTPELSNTPQISRGSDTPVDHYQVSQQAPSSRNSEIVPGSITLGSLGGAEVLREAMSASHFSSSSTFISQGEPLAQHTKMPEPLEQLSTNSPYSSVHDLTPQPSQPCGASNPHDSVDSTQLPQMMHFSSQPPTVIGQHSAYTHPPPPPPPMPQNSFYQPPLPPLPPLQYFDPSMVYTHLPSLPPAPAPTIYGYMAPNLPPPLPPPPPLYHQAAQFESSPPPMPSHGPPNSAITPGLYAPPRSTKVRISNPGGGDSSIAICLDQQVQQEYGNDYNVISPMKTTETGISYYEYNGVTYFGNSGPQGIGRSDFVDQMYQPGSLPYSTTTLGEYSYLSEGNGRAADGLGGGIGPVSGGGGGGQVVLPEVIRPVGIPF
ncbi:expressed protein [Phakopsora pachyrhizi]|uniref:Expressed protein n=1 Tax=Phakopsora pachyrhizi TaxID=170000 RepID=A0AAV0B782_PHAPC|nr:expressed protein [Phakopsora pachyrhizi]